MGSQNSGNYQLLREYPELLKTHLRAVLELSREFDVRVLVPMVTQSEDVEIVKECLVKLGAELGIYLHSQKSGP